MIYKKKNWGLSRFFRRVFNEMFTVQFLCFSAVRSNMDWFSLKCDLLNYGTLMKKIRKKSLYFYQIYVNYLWEFLRDFFFYKFKMQSRSQRSNSEGWELANAVFLSWPYVSVPGTDPACGKLSKISCWDDDNSWN